MFIWLTFYNAVNILDNYLQTISVNHQVAPDHETLAMACILIAAKLDNSALYVQDVFESAKQGITGKEIRRVEFEILKELEFDLLQPCSLQFQILFESLLKPTKLISNDYTAKKFDRI